MAGTKGDFMGKLIMSNLVSLDAMDSTGECGAAPRLILFRIEPSSA
jgi:hypothetical protein